MGPLGVSSMGQHLPLLNSTRAYGLAMNLLASGLRGKSKGSGGTPQAPFTMALRGLTTNKKMMIPLKRPKKIIPGESTHTSRGVVLYHVPSVLRTQPTKTLSH